MKITQAAAADWMQAVICADFVLSNCERQVFKLDVGALVLLRDRFPAVGGTIHYEILDETEYADELQAHSQFGVGA